MPLTDDERAEFGRVVGQGPGLIEDHEFELTRTTALVLEMAAHGIDLVRLPMKDMDVPVDVSAVRELLDQVHERLHAGPKVAVACLGGLGRTGTIVACLLIDAGLSGRDYLVRVFVDVDRIPAEVVTAYRTSRIAKYWRTEP